MNTIIEIDGSILEGGGQILRMSMAFSALTKQPIKVNNIRANRSKGGLRPQHLKGIELANEICGGKLVGAFIDSTEISFYPGNINSGMYETDTGTAGSVVLLLQVALPIALYGRETTFLTLKGGTNCEMAPPIDYTTNVFLPIVQKFGTDFNCEVIRRGYFPKGGGQVNISIPPVSYLKPVTMNDFGEVISITGTAFVAGNLPFHMAKQMAAVAEKWIRKEYFGNTYIKIDCVQLNRENAVGAGSGIVLFAKTNTECYFGSSALGKRGISNEKVGQDAAIELCNTLREKPCVDIYAQDQIIILMALADGKSTVICGPITEHTKTAIFIAEKLTGAKFTIAELNDKCNKLECIGIGLRNNIY